MISERGNEMNIKVRKLNALADWFTEHQHEIDNAEEVIGDLRRWAIEAETEDAVADAAERRAAR